MVKHPVSLNHKNHPLLHNTYALQLADGQSWDLHFTKDLRQWGKAFASTLRLAPGEKDRGQRLIFVRQPRVDGSGDSPAVPIDGSAKPSLGNQAWNVQNPGPVCIWSTNWTTDKVVSPLFSADRDLQMLSMIFSLIPMYHGVIKNGGLPFHAALVTRSGRGTLIAASGAGGKSTCAARIPTPWQALCDDEALIVRDANGHYVAHPLPTWSNRKSRKSPRTWDVQQYVPLQAIFFLEQSEEDTVVETPKTQAAIRAYKSAEQIAALSWRGLGPTEIRKFRQELFDNACCLIEKVPVYILRASCKGRFWEEIERVLP
jgi:SynChlorMet cassette protein ScmC